MLRLRRYRAFLVFAAFLTITLYYFTNVGEFGSQGAASVDDLTSVRTQESTTSSSTDNVKVTPEKPLDDVPKSKPSEDERDTDQDDDTSSDSKSSDEKPSPSSTRSPTLDGPSDEAEDSPGPKNTNSLTAEPPHVAENPADPVIEDDAQGRFEVTSDDNLPKIHWSHQSEHFPVPTGSVISLPTGKPKAIPKIQHTFPTESSASKATRLEKLDKIKKTFAFSWQGYRKNAWMQDELSPVSGRYRNPFCGWAATLVDSLDTLWIMGLKEEFDEAAKAVKNIDFTTSIRNDLPLFEVTIRYLGGLLGAFDISGGTYKVLLDKAVELAEILMGAFDTPNRMPMTFYIWKPTFASQPHRARTRVVLAELGSLSLEFTRLAQITKDAKYYDAIARITNELQNWQNNTKLPGLWPKSVDASGCKKPEILVPALSPLDHSYQKGPGYYNSQTPQIPSEEIQSAATLDSETSVERTTEHNELEDNSIKSEPDSTPTEEKTESKDKRASSSTTVDEQDHEKRQLSDEDAFTEEQSKPDCEPQGLNSPPGTSLEDFTLGGAADSVFEYLPKEYMLLGGLEKQYQKMYESSMETSKKYLLYRPMIEDEERNVLFSGQISTNGQSGEEQYMKLKTEATHLTCFAGGMFAVGAKIFERSYDMDVARRLTDGCIWAYEMTPTGIMPEHFLVVPCDSETKCPFNKTRWFERLDPYHPRSRTRLSSPQMVLNDPNEDLIAKEKPSKVEESSSASTNTSSVSSPKESSTLVKRQLGDFENDSINPRGSNLDGEKEKKAITIDNEDTESPNPEKNSEDSNHSATTTTGEKESEPIVPMIAAYTPPPIPSQEEYARSRIENEKLPRGVVRITGSKYILRPEAIESVFIMYRTTGEEYWREKGWSMFTAIQNYTQAEYGATAISDVMSETAYPLDEMESFWLAETLKYFYLLFSDPELVNLDEYVLNTEAHPFKRPK